MVATTIALSCKYNAPGGGDPVDAPACTQAEVTCFDNGTSSATSLRTCDGVNPEPTITACPWGCTQDITAAHCLEIDPSGGGALAVDLEPDPDLVDVTLTTDDDIHDDGQIEGASDNNRDAGMGTNHGIKFVIRNNIAIYVFKSLTLTNTVKVRGDIPIVLVALEGITVGEIDAQGTCGSGAGPGGFDGGDQGQPGKSTDGTSGTAGSGGKNQCSGGGGAAFGGKGGSGGLGAGGTIGTGGVALADYALIPVLRGGGGGGGGSGSDGGKGGGGGGGIQLVSNGKITISGGINASGCGGDPGGGSQSSGGGGGAGGAILIEAPNVELVGAAFLVVNGGAGASGGGSGSGADGSTTLARALAANPGQDGALGGLGGAGSNLDGDPGGTDTTSPGNGGGGGGGVGWIRINTLSGSAALGNAVISPILELTGSTASQGTPTLH